MECLCNHKNNTVLVHMILNGKRDQIGCGLHGHRVSRHLNTFSDLSIVAVHYTHINTHYVLLLC